MAETVFSCACGMILKVYGEDQAGHETTCPACGATVLIPAEHEARVVPPPSQPVPDEPPSGAGPKPIFLVVYALIILAMTLGAVKFLLLPALNPTVVAANNPVADEETADDAPSDEPKPVAKKARPAAKKRGPVTKKSGPAAKEFTKKAKKSFPVPPSESEPPPAKFEPPPTSDPSPPIASPEPIAKPEDSPKPADVPPPLPPVLADPSKPRFSMVAQKLLDQAKTLEKSRKLDSAIKVYHRVVDSYPGTEQATAAEVRLKYLEKK